MIYHYEIVSLRSEAKRRSGIAIRARCAGVSGAVSLPSVRHARILAGKVVECDNRHTLKCLLGKHYAICLCVSKTSP